MRLKTTSEAISNDLHRQKGRRKKDSPKIPEREIISLKLLPDLSAALEDKARKDNWPINDMIEFILSSEMEKRGYKLPINEGRRKNHGIGLSPRLVRCLKAEAKKESRSINNLIEMILLDAMEDDGVSIKYQSRISSSMEN